MSIRVWKSLGFKQALLALLASAILGLFTSLIEFGFLIDRSHYKLQSNNDLLIQVARGSATSAVWNMERSLAQQVVDSLLAVDTVLSARIETSSGQTLAVGQLHSDSSGTIGRHVEWLFDDLRIVSLPLVQETTRGNRHIGTLQVQMDIAKVSNDFVVTAGYTLLTRFVEVWLLGLLLAALFHRWMTQPLRQLARSISTIDTLNPGINRVHVPLSHANDELGLLATRINEFLATLEQSQEELRQLATRDNLTGMPNRALLAEILSEALIEAEEDGEQLAVVYIDLDRFKTVNDMLGHEIGDSYLRQVSMALSTLVSTERLLGRVGADEFMMVVNKVSGTYALTVLAENILRVINQPYAIHGHAIRLGASVGIAMFPGDGVTPEVLMREADMAMYQAKAQGGQRWRFFSPEMSDHAAKRLELERAMREAISSGGFELFYQAKVFPDNDTLHGFEALIRWRHDGKLISPMDFIPIAEETGMIIEIGDWVLETACKQVADWADRFGPMVMAINVSAKQLSQRGFAEKIIQTIQNNDIRPEWLEVELTESTLIAHYEGFHDSLLKLKRYGVGIAIDDFGTGYSSLSHLAKLPVTTLKIDRAFVGTDAQSHLLARAIMSLARELDLKTVAEGVETEEQRDWLRDQGCDLIQGFFYARPAPALEVEKEIQGRWQRGPGPHKT